MSSVEESTWEALKAAGALKEGHFLLSSGKHSDKYLEKFDLLRNPRETEKACAGFAERFRDANIDVVVGPTTGGVILAFETGRQLGTAAAYAERASEGSLGREIRRGTTFAPGSRVLVVDDVMTTGGAIRETLAALAPHPVEIVGIGVLVDRTGGTAEFDGVPLYALVKMDVKAWEAGDCPLCEAGVPLIKPGTTAVK